MGSDQIPLEQAYCLSSRGITPALGEVAFALRTGGRSSAGVPLSVYSRAACPCSLCL